MDTSEGRFDGLAMSEADLLSALKAERLQSVGFEDNGDLQAQRELALEYLKGEMRDVPSRPNRSSVVSSDLADAVETALPDLMEIFTGGEDIGTFKPDGPEDEERSRLETDFINEVIFDQNPGFMVLQTAIRDALEVKTGIIRHHWEAGAVDEERFEGKTAQELELAGQSSEVSEVEETGVGPDGLPLYNFTAVRRSPGRVVIEAVDPNNFGVSPDTVTLATSPYCVERAFPRAFQLLDEGYDPDLVSMLSPSAEVSDGEDARARDLVGEADSAGDIETNGRGQVEVHIHTIRIDGDMDGKTELWCVVTDSEESVILDAYRKNRVGYAAGCPYPRAHRFYGSSIADKLIEIQRIKTSLMRMLLDSGYFALNQRMEVSEQKMSVNTIADLLRNEPGLPVRSISGDAVRPIAAGGINWDVTGALEYFSTVAEQRTGIVRNAQGLNPDTLHDTAKGAMALMTAAQRRVRFIARILAETLLKDLFIGVHGDIRDHASQPMQAKLNGKWMAIDPTSWGSRADMTIEVGVGSGGRDMEVMAMMQLIGLQKEALEAQAAGVLKSPMVTEENLYASVTRLIERLGLKGPERYVTDPQQAKQLAAQEQGQQGPSPEEQAAMAELQMKQQAQQADIQLQQAKAQADAQAARERNALDIELAREKAAAEAMLARERMASEIELARERAQMEAVISAAQVRSNGLSENRPGGDLSK